MKQPMRVNQKYSAEDKVKIIAVIVCMGILLIILGFLVGVILRQREFQFSSPAIQIQATPTPAVVTVVPTAFIPATGCGSPTLALGTTTFQIQSLTPAADGSLAIPADTSGIAYWIQAGNINPVFLLSPTPQNITAMSTIFIGSTATVTWADCSSATYSLAAPQSGSLDSSVFTDRLANGITIFFPTVSSGAGFVFKGTRIEQPILALSPPTFGTENTLPPTANTNPLPVENTTVPLVLPPAESISSPTAEKIIPTSAAIAPAPPPGETLAEIGVLDTSLSLFGTSLKIEISIHNFGTSAFTLSESDISLTQPDGTPLTLKSSQPNIPMEFQPGETITVELSFEPPSSRTAILKILTVEYDIEGY